MEDYRNINRRVRILPEAEKETNKYRLNTQLNRLVKMLKERRSIKGFKKIQPFSANTYEARLTIKYRAYIIFNNDEAIILKVGDHL